MPYLEKKSVFRSICIWLKYVYKKCAKKSRVGFMKVGSFRDFDTNSSCEFFFFRQTLEIDPVASFPTRKSPLSFVCVIS